MDGSGGGQRSVKTGVRGDQYVEIVEGLSENERVALPDGASVGGFPDGSWPGAALGAS
ncbi:hypothetical protein [Planobispora longispora]|uniref:Uncharacterized protein n=1 Tax=Planobispora longispora TaxID=28887 RepID=A0A8J3RQR7_9ACTN|nr:hypothetical protein [Planobispora longispora]GIH78471.1 hypothetical protein Plo01_49000 [Planobispora longispora]